MTKILKFSSGIILLPFTCLFFFIDQLSGFIDSLIHIILGNLFRLNCSLLSINYQEIDRHISQEERIIPSSVEFLEDGIIREIY